MNMSSKRVATLGAQSALTVAKSGGFQYRQMSEIPIRASLVDTLALVRSLEAQGVPSKQAEAMTSAISTVYNASLGNVSESLKEQQSRLVAAEVLKLRAEIDKMQADFSVNRALLRGEHDQEILELEEAIVRSSSDAITRINHLKAEFEKINHLRLKYAIAVVGATVAAVGAGLLSLRW